MRMFVLGATGKTGRELVDIALARGHDVTAFVRSPGKITRRDPRLSVVKGDPRSGEGIAEALAGHDAVLSALGPTPREAMTRSTLLRDCAASTLAAMRTAGVPRLAIVSSALLFPIRSPLFVISRFVIRPHVRDLRAMEELIGPAEIDWTIARPPRLIGARDERYQAREGELPPGALVLSWRALATFLVDAVQSGRHLRQVVGLRR